MPDLLIGDVCSQMRGLVKAVRQDSYTTDKYLYSLFLKNATPAIKRLDEKKRLTAFASIFESLDFVKLKTIDKSEASVCGVAPRSYSTIQRTCQPIPVFTEGIYGPMIRSITSLDGYELFKLTTPDEYNYISKSTTFKYNTQKYSWYLNDYMYFPNCGYPAVKIEAMCTEDISEFKCDYDQKCKPRQEHSVNIPDYLIAEIMELCKRDLTYQLHAPEDKAHDNENDLR